jgi:predicted nucleic-acid-binding protein
LVRQNRQEEVRITVALTLPTLCELVWVLARGYGIPNTEIGDAVRQLIAGAKVEANRPAIEAGLALLDAGGDFADGVIAFEGASLGADAFASFDKVAVSLLNGKGVNTLLLS